MLRSAQYGDLAQVTEILIDSFYSPTSFTRPYLYLSELSRLQNNFPYSDERHSFFVAVGSIDDEDQIVGFVGENLMLIVLFRYILFIYQCLLPLMFCVMVRYNKEAREDYKGCPPPLFI
jgi:hypothetical protein